MVTLPAEVGEVLSGARRWAVVCADNADVLPLMPAKSVAHVITDAPYSEHTHAKVRRGGSFHLPDEDRAGAPKRATISSAAVLGFDALRPGQRGQCAKEFERVCRRWILEFSDQEGAGPWMNANVAAGLDHIRIGQWVKLNSTPQFTGDRPGTGCEAIVIAHPRGRKKWNGGGMPALWVFPIELNRGGANARLHTTQKPLDLMLKLVEQFTDPDDLVLDPFCGAGTGLIAALRLGRRAIGIELDPVYATTARDRCEAESQGLTLRAARAGQMPMFPEEESKPSVRPPTPEPEPMTEEEAVAWDEREREALAEREDSA